MFPDNVNHEITTPECSDHVFLWADDYDSFPAGEIFKYRICQEYATLLLVFALINTL